MADKITNDTIEYIEILAKLKLNDEEKEAAKNDMQKMLDYIDTLGELNTDAIEPMSHIYPIGNVFREDVVTNGDKRDELLKNAPKVKDGQLVVPKTVE